MSQRDDQHGPRETTVDGGVDATVSSRSWTSEGSALFDGALAGGADPYPVYARLRAEDPIHRTPHGLWVLTRYADVSAVLRDPRFGREGFERYFPTDGGDDGERRRCPTALESEADRGARQSMLFCDPPRHTRLRDLLAYPFAPPAVDILRPRIRSVANRLLDRVDGAGQLDVVTNLAEPLARAVIGDLLGITEADRAAVAIWSAALARSLDALPIPEDRPLLAAGQAARRALGDYTRERLATRRAAPSGDLMGLLIALADDDGLLSDRELVAMAVLVAVAGTETTTSLIGTTVWALLSHPEALARVREAPWHLAAAIEEVLRWESPVQRTWRIAKADVELAGQRIPAGALVVLLLGAANRDPARFPDPDRFDLDRRAAGHLAFSAGVHACLGAALARLEARTAIETLLRRWPSLHLTSDRPAWRPTATLRSLVTCR
jgi:cytochrome P450